MRRSAWVLVCFLLAAALGRAAQPDSPTTQPAEPTNPSPPIAPKQLSPNFVTPQMIEAALVGLVDRVAPSVVLIEASRRPASLTAPARPADDPWVNDGVGIIIRPDGRILTCQHVLAGATEIVVTLFDGRRMPARRIAEDRRSDLAVIRIDAAGLTPATLGGVDRLRRGALVLSLGNPLGLARDGQAAAAHGIVAALGRSLPPAFGHDEDRFYGDMIHTSIPAGPGSSGGPVFASDGRVVGIITAVPVRGGDLSPISFAVPMNERNRGIVAQLAEGRPVEHGYLGVEVDVLSDAQRDRAKLGSGAGVAIAAVFADGPADRAGIRQGDIVTAIGDKPVATVDAFVSLIGAHTAGERASFNVIRDGRPMEILATLTSRPAISDVALPEPLLQFRGAALGRVDAGMRTMANLPASALLVMRVDAGSPADRAGLTPGDVIVRANGAEVPEDAATRLLAATDDVMLGLASGATVVVKP